MTNSARSVASKLRYARTISFFGSAFSDLVLPLFIYEITKSPLLLGLQWTVNAIFRLLTGKISGHINLWKSDRDGIAWLDVLQTGAALIPLLLWTSAPAAGTYIAGVLIAIFTTVQSGYIDSIVGNTAKSESNPNEVRTWINARIENGKNWGLFLGYSIAWVAATYAGFKVAILLDALTFLASAAITISIPKSLDHETTVAPRASYSLLFSTSAARFLTFSQSLMSIAVYVFNASFIFVMKHNFKAPNAAIAALLIFQAVCYMIGTHLTTRFTGLSPKAHTWFRWCMVVVFIGFMTATNYPAFIFWNAVLSLIISFTQPAIASFFQSFANNSNRRALGAARTSVMSISGSIGAAIPSFLLQSHPHSVAFAFASAIALLGACAFMGFARHKKAVPAASVT